MSIVISIENVIKRFRKDTTINDLSLDVKPGEFLTFLGSSGYGRTTLLRMTTGFSSIEGGEIKTDGKIINNTPTDKRNMGMVFQNYVTFPHMSTRDNVAFGLKSRKTPQNQIESQVDEILEVVKVDHLKKRMPSKLFGGQQQHMVLTRAIVIHSEALLMDEPLSNLDAKLRVEVRNIIEHIQQQVGIAAIYVTYDQEETLAVSGRIAVMNGGVIQQIDTPKNVYQWPSSTFVSTFIELSNIVDGRIEAEDGQTFLHIRDYSAPMENLSHSADDGQAAEIPIRPEEFTINREGSDGIPAIARNSIFLGITTHYFMETADGREMEVM